MSASKGYTQIQSTDSKPLDEGKPIQDTENSSPSNLYLQLYEQTLETESGINHAILQNQGEARAAVAQGDGRIYGDIQSITLPTREMSDSLREQQRETNAGHKQLLQNLQEKESLIRMQEERRTKAEEDIRTQEVEAEKKKQMAETLLHHGLKVQDDTLRTRSTVESFRTYKDYVERSVPLWQKEANSVDSVCGRFRDLLTLRFQLVLQVQEAFENLQQAREHHQQLVKSEKVAEGKSLLQVYQCRSSLWKSNRETDAAEAQLKSLRNASAEIATNLTRVKLALANMYSVARRFQVSLPPLQPDTASTDILQHLHNFLLDATRVVKLAKMEENPSSHQPVKGSDD